MAGLIGVYSAFNINNVLVKIRQRDRRDRLLRDIYFELKGNSVKLVGKGYVLNTDIWDSGVSTGIIQHLDSKKLRMSPSSGPHNAKKMFGTEGTIGEGFKFLRMASLHI